MGITVADDQMTRGLAQRLGTPLEGVLVMEAPPNTPGGEAGLTGCMRKAGQLFLGDLITEVNGVAVRTVEDLLALVEETEIGSDVVLRVMRGADAAKLETVRVKTVDRAQLR